MKTTIKIKKIKNKVAKTKAKKKLVIVKLANQKRKLLRHLRLIEKKHTCKLVHHRHTSHLALIVILIFVGIFLFVNQSFVVAQQITKSGSVSVGVIVPGPPPTIGATILSPIDGTSIKTITADVSGICSPSTLVIIYNNSLVDGSTVCTTEGIFSLKIQFKLGGNALQAMNYDNMNQAGPGTPVVTITVKEVTTPLAVPETLLTPVIATPSLVEKLENPAIIPALTPTKRLCDAYNDEVNTSPGDLLEVIVVCVVRGLQVGQQSAIGLTVHGGQPPYAVNINLDSDNLTKDSNTLLSISDPGYKPVPVIYNEPGIYTVKVKAKDKVGLTAITQTVVEVNGIAGLNTFASIKDTVMDTSWLQTSVPVYLLVLVLTLGFWVGDVFDRHFSITRLRKQQRRSA